MCALVIKALKVRPVVRRKVWLHYQISATWTWRVTTTIFFITWLVIQWQCGSVVWEPPIPLASVLSCPVVWAKSGKEMARLSRWRHSSCTVESRIDRAKNAMELGWSHPGTVSLVKKMFKNGQERGESLGCYSYWTSSTTSPNACLCFGHKKYFCVQSETSAHLSHCVRDLLTQRSWPANSTAPPTPRIRPLAGAGNVSSRIVFSENKPPKFTLQVSFDSLVSSRRKA